MNAAAVVYIKPISEDFQMPVKASEHAACYDVYATSKEVLPSGAIKYGLGFALEPPFNHQVDLRPRSSIHKQGMILSNCIGTGDPDYRGEYAVVFYKILPDLPDYEVGDRVIQMQFNRIVELELERTTELSDTIRGEGGFGSTGLK